MKLKGSGQAPRNVRLFRAALICLLIVCLLEFVLANRDRLFVYSEADHAELDLSDYCDEDIYANGTYILMPEVTGDGELRFSDVPCGIFSLSFDIRYFDSDVEDTIPAPTVTLTARDPRTTWESGGFITLCTEAIAVGEGGEFRSVTVYASTVGSGETGDLRIAFSDLGGIVELQNIRINTPQGWTFSILRVLFFAALAFLPCALWITGLFSTDYDPENIRHRRGIKSVIPVTVLLSLLFSTFFLGESEAIPYPLEGAIRDYQPYIQQFDAFMKGQLHLDVPVPEEILSMENPYVDSDARSEVDALWDRAYYDGHYYSYFGIAPILVLYLPHYLFSGFLPSDTFVLTALLLVCAVFIPLTVLKWADLHEKKTLPIPVLWLGALTAFIGSMMLLVSRGVKPFYYIATLSAGAFLSMLLYFLLKTAEADRLRDKVFYSVFSGVSYALLLHSRPSVALLAVFPVIPFLVFRVFKKRTGDDAEKTAPDALQKPLGMRLRAFFAPPKEILVSLVALGTPVLIGLAAVLYLNAARFGSVFEFGTSYQLTVSDVRYNTVSLINLFPTVYHYFCQPLRISAAFPFCVMEWENIRDYGHYVYSSSNFGLFALPLMRALLLSPVLFFFKNRTRCEKTLLGCILLGCLTVALFDFSIGGVIFRYVADLTVLASICAVCLVFALYGAVAGKNKDAAVTGVMLFFVFSCVTALLLSISFNENLSLYAADVFAALKNFFLFR